MELKRVLVFVFLYGCFELFMGWWANSLLLVSDGFHMSADVGSLAIAIMADWLAENGHTQSKNMAAIANALILMAMGAFVISEALDRYHHVGELQGHFAVIAVAAVGLVVNAKSAQLLRPRAKHDHNMRGAYLHIIGDGLTSIAVIVGTLAIYADENLYWLDSFFSIFIGAALCALGFRLFTQTIGLTNNIPH